MCISDLVMVQQYYKENMGLYISSRLQFVLSVPAPCKLATCSNLHAWLPSSELVDSILGKHMRKQATHNAPFRQRRPQNLPSRT